MLSMKMLLMKIQLDLVLEFMDLVVMHYELMLQFAPKMLPMKILLAFMDSVGIYCELISQFASRI